MPPSILQQIWNRTFLITSVLTDETYMHKMIHKYTCSSQIFIFVSGFSCIVQQYQKLGESLAGPTNKLLLSFIVISIVYMSFIPNLTAFTKYRLTQWISKLTGALKSTERGSTCLVNFTGFVGIVNATVCKAKPIVIGLGHGKLS